MAGDHEATPPPLSARSVALSLLLGARPPRLRGRDVVTLGEMFGVAVPTMRVALSRMVAAGDLEVDDGIYTLGPQHLDRQRVTEALAHPRRRPYDGMWRMLVVVDRGRPAPERAALRRALTRARHAELREGVWLRPDNLHPQPEVADPLLGPSTGRGPADAHPAGSDDPGLLAFSTRPAKDRALTRQLWDLPGWASTAHRLLSVMRSDAPPPERLTAAAAAVRHLCLDPALPDELAPEQWPADDLRWAYEDFRNELSSRYLGTTTSADPVGGRTGDEPATDTGDLAAATDRAAAGDLADADDLTDADDIIATDAPRATDTAESRASKEQT